MPPDVFDPDTLLFVGKPLRHRLLGGLYGTEHVGAHGRHSGGHQSHDDRVFDEILSFDVPKDHRGCSHMPLSRPAIGGAGRKGG